MTDSVGKIFLEKLRKTLLPDFTNKLTWLLGSAGVTLIAGPAIFRLIGKISADLYGVPLEVEFFTEDRSGYGVLLCLLAVIQNIGYQLKGGLSEAYAIKDLDRRHEMEMLQAKQEHDRFMAEAESDKGMSEAKRKHDLDLIENITSTFPYEESCNSLVRTADVGISDTFQENLESLANMHYVSQKMYNNSAEEARKELIIQAKETQSVLSSHLVTDPRFDDRYVPCFEQKHNGMHQVYYANQETMRLACISLIRSYEKFVQTLQEQTLWGVQA